MHIDKAFSKASKIIESFGTDIRLSRLEEQEHIRREGENRLYRSRLRKVDGRRRKIAPHTTATGSEELGYDVRYKGVLLAPEANNIEEAIQIGLDAFHGKRELGRG